MFREKLCKSKIKSLSYFVQRPPFHFVNDASFQSAIDAKILTIYQCCECNSILCLFATLCTCWMLTWVACLLIMMSVSFFCVPLLMVAKPNLEICFVCLHLRHLYASSCDTFWDTIVQCKHLASVISPAIPCTSDASSKWNSGRFRWYSLMQWISFAFFYSTRFLMHFFKILNNLFFESKHQVYEKKNKQINEKKSSRK